MTEFIRRPTFQEALGQIRNPAGNAQSIMLPLRGAALEAAFQPLFTKMDAQKAMLDQSVIIRQALEEFSRRTGQPMESVNQAFQHIKSGTSQPFDPSKLKIDMDALRQ